MILSFWQKTKAKQNEKTPSDIISSVSKAVGNRSPHALQDKFGQYSIQKRNKSLFYEIISVKSL